MEGGVPRSSRGGSARVEDEGRRDGLAERSDWFSAMMRSTSPSSGVRRRVRVCRFFGVVGFGVIDGFGATSLAIEVDADSGAGCTEPTLLTGAAASFASFDLADRLLLLRLILALEPAVK